MIKIGEFIRKVEQYSIFDSEGNSVAKQRVHNYRILAVDGNKLEVMNYRGTPEKFKGL